MGYLITLRTCGFILSMLWRKNSASDGGAKGLRADITTGAKVLPVYRYIDTLLFLPDYCHTYSDYMRHMYFVM